MTEKAETERDLGEPKPAPARRPWHAPQFVSTDVAATDVVGNAGTDGGPMGSLS